MYLRYNNFKTQNVTTFSGSLGKIWGMKIKIIITLILLPFICNGQYDSEDNDYIYHSFSFGNNYEVFVNEKKKTWFITDQDEKTLVKNLNYAVSLGKHYLQVLNKKNEIVYYDSELRKIKKPKGINYIVCGTVNSYKYRIVKENSLYFVERSIDRSWTGGNITKQIIDTISNKNYDKVYFINKSAILQFDDNNTYPTFLVFEKNLKRIIFHNNTEYEYDLVQLKKHLYQNLVLVNKDGLYNYFSFSPEVRYSQLDDFTYNLAYFELPNGKKGYLDIDGNEYFKN